MKPKEHHVNNIDEIPSQEISDPAVLSKNPLVSVHMITYNHEPYIAQAIEGVLIQENTFPIELIVSDDCSTDNTPKIIQKYYEENPKIIRVIKRSENIGSINNWIDTFKHCKGKYIAICEGDDYWNDPYKLQKQVDFLEKNEKYGVVHADCNFYLQEKETWEYQANKQLLNKSNPSHKDELFKHIIDASYKVRTATVLFRKDLLEKIKPNAEKFLMGDTPMWLDFSQLTKFYYMDEVHSVYRIIDESASRPKNKIKQLRFSLSMAEMRVYYCRKHGYPISPQLKRRYNQALLIYRLYDSSHKDMFQLQSPSSMQFFIYKTNKNNAFIKNFYKIFLKIYSYYFRFIKVMFG